MKEMRTGYTHNGCFHADEVMATALLRVLFPKMEVIRVASASEIPSPLPDGAIVYDIGGGEFDHHNVEKRCWKDGTPASSAGLIWWKYSEAILQELVGGGKNAETARVNIEEAIKAIDAVDNGVYVNGRPLYDWSSFIFSLNPNWDEEATPDEYFKRAVFFSRWLLENAAFGVSSKDPIHAIAEKADQYRRAQGWERVAMPVGRKYYPPACDPAIDDAGLFWEGYGIHVLESFSAEPEYISKAMMMVDARLFRTLDSNYWNERYLPRKFLRYFLPDDGFMLVSEMLKRVVLKVLATLRGSSIVEAAIESSEDGVAVLERFVPWQGTLAHSKTEMARSVKAVVYPSNRGDGYNAAVLRERALFPESWAGQPEAWLMEHIGINFCHPARFVISAPTKEAAIMAAKLAE